MLKIHHATKTKAEKAGFVLTATETSVRAHHAETNQISYGPDAKSALQLGELNQVLRNDYPGVSVSWDPKGVIDTPWVLFIKEDQTDTEWDSCPELADITDALAELEVEIDEDEAEEGSGSVVKSKYKQEYAARGDVRHCGDWLALFLKGRFVTTPARTGKDGRELKSIEVFDYDAFADMLKANGIQFEGAWAQSYLSQSGPNGWQGRFRMDGRRKLEIVIAQTGHLLFGGKKIKPDADWLDEMRTKHAKHIEPKKS